MRCSQVLETLSGELKNSSRQNTVQVNNMRQIISERIATIALLTIFSLTILFHILIIMGVIPFDIVWGGRLESREQMISFEITSIFLVIIMLATVAIYAGYLKIRINAMVIKAALWFMVVLFLINTIGNILSNNEMEKLIFTPVTLLLSLLCLRLAIE